MLSINLGCSGVRLDLFNEVKILMHFAIQSKLRYVVHPMNDWHVILDYSDAS